MNDRSRLTWGLWLIAAVLAVPIVPFLLLGEAYEGRVRAWVAGEWSAASQFWLIVAALSSDIFLPVPSSSVITLAGGRLGIGLGTLASWLGMTLGSIVGFALSRLLGEPFAKRFGGRDVASLTDVVHRYGAAAILLTRPLPILAEACVLLMGAARLSWRRFLPPIVLGNLVISLAYTLTGAYFRDQDMLPHAVIATGLIPLGIALLLRRRWLSDGNETRLR